MEMLDSSKHELKEEKVFILSPWIIETQSACTLHKCSSSRFSKLQPYACNAKISQGVLSYLLQQKTVGFISSQLGRNVMYLNQQIVSENTKTL